MISDNFVMLINFILIGILLYCLYDYTFVPKREPLMGQIKRGLRDIGRFPGQIAGLGRQVGDQIRRVGSLGREIGRLGGQIARFPGQVAGEMGDVFNKAQSFVNDGFNKVKNEVTDIAGEVQGIAEDFYGEAAGMAGEIGGVLEDIPGEVEGMARMIFLDKIPNAFTSAWDWVYDNIFSPIIGFFYDLGDIFEDVGNVFIEIFYFLIRIPSCIPIYMFDTCKTIAYHMFLTIAPTWLKDILRFIYRYVFELILFPIFGVIIYVLKFFAELLGFQFKLPGKMSKVFAKCYDTGVIGQIIDMVLGLIMTIFSGLADIFRMFNFQAVIDQIMSIF